MNETQTNISHVHKMSFLETNRKRMLSRIGVGILMMPNEDNEQRRYINNGIHYHRCSQ